MTTPITTTTELEALPINSVILDSDGVAWQRLEANWWKSTDGTGTGGVQGIFSPPWTLLHVPGQAPECDHAALVRELARTTVLSLASAEAVVHAATTWTAPAPTVKPGRDAVLAALLSVKAGPSTNALADAVLAILPGKTEQEVRAEALRDAKARIALDFTFSGHEVAAWLDALADEVAGK